MAVQSQWRTDHDQRRAGDLRERLSPVDYSGVPKGLHDLHRSRVRNREPPVNWSDLREIGKAVLREAVAASGDDDVLMFHGTSKL
jgi:hypothetical protein